MLFTRKNIRDSVLSTTQQLAAQIGDLVNDFINITIQEISNPAWAFKEERHHLWSWLKRKTTFTATSEDTVMERDVDKIALMRQTDSPAIITYVPDEIFYKELPNPTESGNPRIYRLWETIGVSTKLSAANTLKVSSSSASDDSNYIVVITGYVSGRLQSESFTMNGTSNVIGSTTFDAREIFVSKSSIFNGNLTVKDGDNNTLVVIGKEETSPRFKVVSLYPTPTSTIVYLEYYKRIKQLNDDNEMPEFDPKWHHVIRIGTIAKVYGHLSKTDDEARTNQWYAKMVRAMVAEDSTNPDAIFYLRKRNLYQQSGIRLHISEDIIA